MSVFNNLLPASFNNVPFYVIDESKTGGKKTVKHEYAGANRRFIEELGDYVPEYFIRAIVHGNDAIQQRIRLETELKKEGRGLLTHPVLGQLMVTALDYTSSSSDSKLGEFSFDINFAETEENISLTPSVSSVQSISSLISQAHDALDNGFVNIFSNNTFPDIILGTSNQLTSILNETEGFIGGVANIIPKSSSAFTSTVDRVLNSANTIARRGSDIAGQLRGVYNAIENISDDIPSFFSSWLNLSDFGLGRSKKELTTQKRIIEENNLSVLEDHTNLNALLGLYESASYKDYTTDVDLLRTQDTLDEKYAELVDGASDGSLAYSSEFRALISNVRVKSREILERKAQNIWRVVDINPNESSMALTSYRYYGDLENLESLIDLNPLVNVAINNETIKGVS